MDSLVIWKILIFILVLIHALVNLLIFYPVIKKNYITTLLRYREYKWKLIYNVILIPLFFEILIFQNALVKILLLPFDLERILTLMLLVSLVIMAMNDIICLVSFDKLCCLTIANSWIFCIVCITSTFFIVLYPVKFYFSLVFSLVYAIVSISDAYSFLAVSIITKDRFVNEQAYISCKWELPETT